MSRRILVVGGAGYIGSHMVKHLRQAREEVVVLDNLCNGHRQALPADVRLYEHDMQNRPEVEKILRQESITHVMHFAAHAYVGESVAEPLKYYSNNVAATVALLQAMKAIGVRNFVFSSSCATYGTPPTLPIQENHPQNPINPYGETKLVIEKLLRSMAAQDQLSYAALRYFNAAGASSDGTIGEDHTPESHLIPLVLQVALGQRKSVSIFGSDYPTPDGTCLRDYIHVEDLAEAHLRALHLLQPGIALELNLGTGQPASVKEVVEVCRQVTGHAIPVTMEPRRAGDPAALYADNTLALQTLRWQPRHTSLRSIIQTAWQWHRRHPRGYASAEKSLKASLRVSVVSN